MEYQYFTFSAFHAILLEEVIYGSGRILGKNQTKSCENGADTGMALQ